MTEYLGLNASNCKHCYKCIRNCPVKAISFSSQRATVLQKECILCGRCVVICPQNAKTIHDDTSIAKQLIASGQKVVASVAPAFAGNYYGVPFNNLRKALIKLGFADAQETAIGAAIVKSRYEEIVKNEEQAVVISSCCHSVNSLIQKYYPEALACLAKISSPMQAHSQMLKREDANIKTVFIGPCISKKAEAQEFPGIVDCVLTFEELDAWFDGENIVPQQGEIEKGGRSRLFPVTGGILRSMKTDNRNYSYIAIDGVENCISALKDIISGEISNCFVEMSACVGSCVCGPAMQKNKDEPVKKYLAVNSFASKEEFSVQLPEKSLLDKAISFELVGRPRPGEHAINEVLKQIGKTLPEHELNCGCCGYDTCREKAAAVIAGKADLSMCLPFLMGKAESFSDTIIKNTPNGIIVLSNMLEIQQINAAAQHILNVRHAEDVLNQQVVCVLDPVPFFEVLESKRNIYDQKTFLAEYGRYIRQTVLYDRSYEIIICIMRDVTEIEEDRAKKTEIDRKTIEITDKVVEKQMRAVQEIASLLGETAAETKIALTKLKETLQDE